MQQEITGFHKDEWQDWVAELACGHFQHVRHDPPWMNRSWVLNDLERNAKIGLRLDCKKCDRDEPADQTTGPEI